MGISGGRVRRSDGVTLIALAVAHRVRGTASILVVGLMIGYLLAALVSLLVAGADPARLRQFVTWGFGSFRGVTNAELKVMAPVLIAGIAVSLLSTKTLNALLLGERYAESMGVAVRRDRLLILLVTSMLGRCRHRVRRPGRLRRCGRAAPRPPARARRRTIASCCRRRR